MRFNLNRLPSPRLTDLPFARYQELIMLARRVLDHESDPVELLCQVTSQLPSAIVDRLLEILRDESDLVQGDEEAPAVRATLFKYGRMEFYPSTLEDVFLAKAWLELADRALEHEEPGPLAIRVALVVKRDERGDTGMLPERSSDGRSDPPSAASHAPTGPRSVSLPHPRRGGQAHGGKMKIRLEGTKGQCDTAVRLLERMMTVNRVSPPQYDRGNARQVRVYLDVDLRGSSQSVAEIRTELGLDAPDLP